MAQKILLVLILSLCGRVLQNSDHKPDFFKAGRRRIFTNAKLDYNCSLQISKKLNVHKSFYCFKKQKIKNGTNIILSASPKTKPPAVQPVVQIFIPMKKWGKIYFIKDL